MKNTKLITLIFLFFTFYVGVAQVHKDLDGDAIKDKVDYDHVKSQIICRLSTRKFQAIISKANLSDTPDSGVRATKSGFEFYVAYMRSGDAAQFCYDKTAKKIRLVGMSRYEFGPANNDGSGESSVNLLTNNYIGNWNYYYDKNLNDSEQGELLKIPTIKVKMYFPKQYLEDYDGSIQSDYENQCYELYEKHKTAFIKSIKQ